MKADYLSNWDKTELASLLAIELADADDLIEAFPLIGKESGEEEKWMAEYIVKNYKVVLDSLDDDEVYNWYLEHFNQETIDNWEHNLPRKRMIILTKQ